VVAASSHHEAAARLGAWLEHEPSTSVANGRITSAISRGVVFVFPGQGSQRGAMGRELCERCPVFRAALIECDDAIREYLGRSVIEEVHGVGGEVELEGIDVIQPALFAIGVALSARWRSLGIEPTAVVGHSMGEVAAAHVAGALSLEDATRVICRRSTLLRRISGHGAMLVVALDLGRADALIDAYRDRVSIAVSNSPTSTVLSGDPATLSVLAGELREANVFSRPVKVDVASHSPQVDELRDELLAQLSDISPRRATVPILSTVSGELCDGSAFDAEYWAQNLREPVLFWSALRTLVDKHDSGVFIEMSPHPVLLSAVEQVFELTGREGVALASMRRDEPETQGTVVGLGSLHAHGFTVPLERLSQGGSAVPLPSYRWQHERFWFRTAGDHPADPSSHGLGTPALSTAPVTFASSEGVVDSDLLRRMASTPPEAQREMVFDFVLDTVASVLRFDPGRIDPSDGFFQLGMDSRLATQVRVRVEAAFMRKLSATIMFEHATIAALTDHLVGLSRPDVPGPRAVEATPARSGPDPGAEQAQQLEAELSEEELVKLLAEEVRTSLSAAGDQR
jgi:acyl transferase domain-containing protein